MGQPRSAKAMSGQASRDQGPAKPSLRASCSSAQSQSSASSDLDQPRQARAGIRQSGSVGTRAKPEQGRAGLFHPASGSASKGHSQSQNQTQSELKPVSKKVRASAAQSCLLAYSVP